MTVADSRVEIDVLGPSRVLLSGTRVPLTRQDLRVLTALVVLGQGGVAVDGEAVKEHAWKRVSSTRALSSCVYRLRKSLGDNVLQSRGHMLRVDPQLGHSDLDQFVILADQFGKDRDLSVGREALQLVRGLPFAEFADHPSWKAIRDTWVDRINAVRDQFAAQLIDADDLTQALEVTRLQLVDRPHDADRWARLIGLLHSLGRPVDAARAVEEARRAFAAVGFELPSELRAVVASPTRSTRASAVHTADDSLVTRLSEIAAMLRERFIVSRVAGILDESAERLAIAVQRGVAAGVLVGDVSQLGLAASVDPKAITDRMTPSAMRVLATRLLEAAPWSDQHRMPFAQARLLIAADADQGWDESAIVLWPALEPDDSLHTDEVVEVISELHDMFEDSSSIPPGQMARLLSVRAIARHESEDHEGSLADTREAYRIALTAGDFVALSDVLANSCLPEPSTVLDLGNPSLALARSWRPSAVTPYEVAIADAVLAFHLLARGPMSEGILRGRAAVHVAQQADDPVLLSRVVALLTAELMYDRSFMEEASAWANWCRRSGDPMLISQALFYLLGGRVRAQESTLRNPLADELELLSQDHKNMWVVLRHSLLNMAEGSLRADPATVQLWKAILADGTAGQALPMLVGRMLGVHEILLASPDWGHILPHTLIGDPADWMVSSPTDLALWRAARCAEQGDRPGSAAELSVVGPLINDTPSVLMVARLPLAAMIVNRVGDRDLAAEVLEANIEIAGSDLCLLPAVHLGPTDSWLALIADVAQDPRASALHATADLRLKALDARVLERG